MQLTRLEAGAGPRSRARGFLRTLHQKSRASPGRACWLWTITALKRPKGWRKPAGHRTTVLDARGAARDYWSRRLAAVALRPDLPRLAKQSLKVERGSAKKPVWRRTSTKAGKSSSG